MGFPPGRRRGRFKEELQKLVSTLQDKLKPKHQKAPQHIAMQAGSGKEASRIHFQGWGAVWLALSRTHNGS